MDSSGPSSPDFPTPASSPLPRMSDGDTQVPMRASKPRNTSAGIQPPVPTPKLRLFFEDLVNPSSTVFLKKTPDPKTVIETALSQIVKYLYTSPNPVPPAGARPGSVAFDPSLPGTRSVTFYLDNMSGVAYTTGTALDNDHKEIHFSLSYIGHTATLADPGAEIAGVLTHELVHCYQHTRPDGSDPNVIPSPPGGLIEGIADFVRLKAGLGAAHWKRPVNAAGRAATWDAGYQHTAYFLDWIEDVRIGEGAIGMLNDRLRRTGYVDGFWKGLFGFDVLELWGQYGQYLDGLAGGGEARRNGSS